MNNNDKNTQTLRDLAAELRTVHEVLSELCEQLQGGGIMQARDIEPAVAQSLPTLQHAVETLDDASHGRGGDDRPGDADAPGQRPFLM